MSALKMPCGYSEPFIVRNFEILDDQILIFINRSLNENVI